MKLEEFILVCEDDHQFTEDYSVSFLFSCIEETKEKDGDILAGGVDCDTAGVHAGVFMTIAHFPNNSCNAATGAVSFTTSC